MLKEINPLITQLYSNLKIYYKIYSLISGQLTIKTKRGIKHFIHFKNYFGWLCIALQQNKLPIN